MSHRMGRRALACAAFVLTFAWAISCANAQQAHTDHSQHSANEHAKHMAREKAQKKPARKKKGTRDIQAIR